MYSKFRISEIVGNVRIYENFLIIQKYLRTPLKRGKKISYPMKMLQNILVPPCFSPPRYPAVKMTGPLYQRNCSSQAIRETLKPQFFFKCRTTRNVI